MHTLPNDRVLVVGGNDGSGSTSNHTAELCDVAVNGGFGQSTALALLAW